MHRKLSNYIEKGLQNLFPFGTERELEMNACTAVDGGATDGLLATYALRIDSHWAVLPTPHFY